MSAPSATNARISRQRLVEAARHAGVGARQQQNAFVAAGLDRRPAAQNCMLAIDYHFAPSRPSGRGHILSSISTAAAPRRA